VAYYRIKQVDNDGTETISSVRTIDMDGKNLVSFAPNPTKNDATFLTILNDKNEENTVLRVFTTQGNLIKTIEYPLHFGINILELNTADLPNNMYIINTIIGNKAINTKLSVN
jgi:hypothetical protein